MEDIRTDAAEVAEDRRNFQLISKSAFWMQPIQVIAPKPTRHYHYHDCYELYYLYSGERYYFIKDKSYHVTEGSLVLVNAYDIHATTNSESFGYKRLLINFKKAFLAPFLNILSDADPLWHYGKTSPVLTLTPAQRQYVEALFEQMLTVYHTQDEGWLLFLQTSLLQLLLFIRSHQTPLADKSGEYLNAAHKTISQVSGYINNHYAEPMTLQTISERFYISPYYFSRTFKQITGFTFIEYLNGVRIKEAQKLLRKTNLSIGKIAESVGYQNNTHFGRLFKKATGISPLAYRKQCSGENAFCSMNK